MDSGIRSAIGGCSQSIAEQRLSGSTGPLAGRFGHRNGSVRRRLCGIVSHTRSCRCGVVDDSDVGGCCRSHAASDKDAYRRFSRGELCISGVRISGREALASQEEYSETERQSSQQDETYVRRIAAVCDRAVESDASRLVRLLQAQQLSECVSGSRSMASWPSSQHSAETPRRLRSRPRKRSSALAKSLLR